MKIIITTPLTAKKKAKKQVVVKTDFNFVCVLDFDDFTLHQTHVKAPVMKYVNRMNFHPALRSQTGMNSYRSHVNGETGENQKNNMLKTNNYITKGHKKKSKTGSCPPPPPRLVGTRE